MPPRITNTSRSWRARAYANVTCAWHRLEQRALGVLDLRDWSGIFLGGGPFNTTDPGELKSPVQRRVEADLRRLLDQVTDADFPFLGACYGIGTLGAHQGAAVDRQYAEPVGPVPVTLTREGRQDPLLSGLPATFDAFTGHKEAISVLPAPRRPACRVPGLPGAGVPDRLPCVRNPVPSRTGRGRPVYPDRRLQARWLFRTRASRRTQGEGLPHQRHLPARHRAAVCPALREASTSWDAPDAAPAPARTVTGNTLRTRTAHDATLPNRNSSKLAQNHQPWCAYCLICARREPCLEAPLRVQNGGDARVGEVLD